MKPEHIFHEIYGAYFTTIKKLIDAALQGDLQREDVEQIIRNSAYQETSWLLTGKVEKGNYKGILDKNYNTSLCNNSAMPITELEQRWLKTISLDPRIRLFDFEFQDLENVEPLYLSDDIYICGQYGEGDDYNDNEYIKKYKIVLCGLREKKKIILKYRSAHDEMLNIEVIPLFLQYSLKEDKFRLMAVVDGNRRTFNLSRIEYCELGKSYVEGIAFEKPEIGYVEVSLKNERQTLERFLLYFANYERKTVALDNGTFIVKMRYPKQDETEVLVNILSFTPMVKIKAPQCMVQAAKLRINRQKYLFNY